MKFMRARLTHYVSACRTAGGNYQSALDVLHAEALEEDAKRTPGLWRLVQWSEGTIVYTGDPQPFTVTKTAMEILQRMYPSLEFAIEPVREKKKPEITVYYRVEFRGSKHWQTFRGNLTEEAAREALRMPVHPTRAVKVTEEIMEGWGS